MNITSGSMLRLLTPALAALSLTFFLLGLGGCGGISLASFPPVPTQTPIGVLQGSDFGGHAPITGAHIFLFEATWNGYSAGIKSLLSSGSTATSGTYPVAQDTTTGSVTNGLYYVTSDSNGAFNITGDYTCDANWPVYIYASGGTPGGSTPITITAIASSLSSGTTTYTFTAANLLYTGQTVQFSSSSLGGKWATLNGTTQTVLATPTTTSFQVATTIAPSGSTNTQNGSATATGATNPAIVNLAMLGNCPGVGNFTGALRWVYLNEVSTVATAFAMSGFATDGMHIGSTTTNQVGIENAALNAANLYNIQGGPYELSGNSSAGEGQIANQATPAGNGTVPQAELNTVANILAACVDSANTTASPSTACTTLFADATTTGTSSGTKPIDIATAAINISNNPGAANVIALFSLASGVVPFSPQLTAAPRDFTVAITYNNIASPAGIAIDASGNAYIPTLSTAGYVTKLSPQGAVLATSATGGNGFNSIAVAPNGNVLVSANVSNAVYEYTSSLGAVTGSPITSPAITAPVSVIADSSSNIYVTDGAGSIIRKFTSTGALSASITNSCLNGVSAIALDSSSYLWALAYSASDGCRISNPGGAQAWDLGGSVLQPGNIALDSNSKGWAPPQKSERRCRGHRRRLRRTLRRLHRRRPRLAQHGSPSTAATIFGSPTPATRSPSPNSAIAATAMSGTSGYQGGVLSNPSFLAIDASGDVWVANYGNNTVTELIGAATPVVTPLSAQQPGVRP